MRRQRKIIKRKITKDQFLAILSKAAQPVKDWRQSDSASGQTSESRLSDGCVEKRTRSGKTGDI